jgi:hypothetical protein
MIYFHSYFPSSIGKSSFNFYPTWVIFIYCITPLRDNFYLIRCISSHRENVSLKKILATRKNIDLFMMTLEDDYSYTDLYAVIEKRVPSKSSRHSSESERSAHISKGGGEQRRQNCEIRSDDQDRRLKKKNQESVLEGKTRKTEIEIESRTRRRKKSLDGESMEAPERTYTSHIRTKRIEVLEDIRANPKLSKSTGGISNEINQDIPKSNRVREDGKRSSSSSSEWIQDVLEKNTSHQRSSGIPRKLSVDKSERSNSNPMMGLHRKSQNNRELSSSPPSELQSTIKLSGREARNLGNHRMEGNDHEKNGYNMGHLQKNSSSSSMPPQRKLSNPNVIRPTDDRMNNERNNHRNQTIRMVRDIPQDKNSAGDIHVNNNHKLSISKTDKSPPYDVMTSPPLRSDSYNCRRSYEESQVSKIVTSKEQRKSSQTNPMAIRSTASEHHHGYGRQLPLTSIHRQASTQARLSRSLSPGPAFTISYSRRQENHSFVPSNKEPQDRENEVIPV